MSLTQQTFHAPTTKEENDIFYKVIIENDLSKLTPTEKVQHIANVCKSLGLNPLTKPIQLHKFQGKEVMYMAKDGTEQLRNLHTVSIVKLETEFLKNDLYVVKAYATKPNGRQDCSTSAQALTGLKGDALCNAMKKCETQAKRRVTLSICGLGMLDESELENLPQDNIVPIVKAVINELPIANESVEIEPYDFDQAVEEMNACANFQELTKVYTAHFMEAKKRRDVGARNKLVSAYAKKKASLESSDILASDEKIQEFLNEYDGATGEVAEAQS